ncbi:MAG: hypothetical protein EA398_17255 [Deltaproteobacteria bacterium]|nr:MAG: hypothetical protein EA398_17255 [Deltaproteobacteria bacterium]
MRIRRAESGERAVAGRRRAVRVRREGAWIPVLFALLLAGCPQARPDRPVPAPGPVEFTPERASDDPAAVARFGDAVALYEAGRFDAAADAFRLFAAEFPGDALTLPAERYLGRSLAASGRAREAEEVFRSLELVPEARASARLYLAFVAALQGEDELRDRRMDELLRDTRDARVDGTQVVPGDEPLLASLLAEARIRRGEFLGALRDLDVVHASATDALLRSYAMDRAVEIATLDLDADALRRAASSDATVKRAAAAPLQVLALLEADRRDEAVAVLEAATEALVSTGQVDALVLAQTRLATTGERRELRYGVILSLSGPDRGAGRQALGAILLAQRAFEPEDAVSLALIRDAAGSAEQVTAHVEELVGLGVSAIIGPIEHPLAAAGQRAAARHGVPYVALTPLPLPERVEATWRLQVDGSAEARSAVAEAVRVRRSQRFVIVREEDESPWLDHFASAAASAIEEAGGEVLLEVSVGGRGPALQESAERAVRRIASTEADAVVLALSPATAGPFVAWMAGQGIWSATDARTSGPGGRRAVTYVGNSFLLNESLLRNSAEYLVGAILPWWYHPDLATGDAAAFTWRFEHTYGRRPGPLEAFAHDAASIVRRLLVAEGQRNPRRFAARMQSDEGFETVTGRILFDGSGDARMTPRFATVQAGRLVAR